MFLAILGISLAGCAAFFYFQPRWKQQKRIQRRLDFLNLRSLQHLAAQAGEKGRAGAVYRLKAKMDLVESREFKLLTYAALGGALLAIKFLPPAAFSVAVAFAAVLFAYRYIHLWTKQARFQSIREEMPGALDLLAICLSSGLGIHTALERILREMEETPLQEEFRQIVNESNTGIPFEEALRNFSSRIPISDIMSLTGAIIQAHKTGVSLAETIKIQSETMRETMKMRLRERLMKVPVIVMFPMVLFIMPVVLFVILGPALIEFFKGFEAL